MTQTQLIEKLTAPSPGLDMMKRLEGDILVLGAGGKMGPTLCELCANAVRASGVARRVMAVSRWSDAAQREQLNKVGVETISADLMDDAQLAALPDCPNVIYMVGLKFGTTGNEGATWAMNVYLPGRVAQRYKDSRIVVFSSGNIYPYLPINQGGATENTDLVPVGEYAMTCLGRERVFDYYSRLNNTPMSYYRLSYAVEMRYGVLYDIASMVHNGTPIPMDMGFFCCIWQALSRFWNTKHSIYG